MNQDQFLSTVRAVVSGAGVWAIQAGYVSGETMTLIGGVITAVAMLCWSLLSHRDFAKVAAAQNVGSAQVAVSDPALYSPGVVVAPPGAKTVIVPVPNA